MTLVHVALISVPSPSLSELFSDWQFNRDEALWRISRDSAVSLLAEMTLTSAEMKSLECVSCWFNQDEVVGVVIVDHRLLLGEWSFVVAPGDR